MVAHCSLWLLSPPALALGKPVQTSLEVAPVWVPDAESTGCSVCSRSFTLLRRRHHCRQWCVLPSLARTFAACKQAHGGWREIATDETYVNAPSLSPSLSFLSVSVSVSVSLSPLVLPVCVVWYLSCSGKVVCSGCSQNKVKGKRACKPCFSDFKTTHSFFGRVRRLVVVGCCRMLHERPTDVCDVCVWFGLVWFIYHVCLTCLSLASNRTRTHR